jgi:hypothetical protein
MGLASYSRKISQSDTYQIGPDFDVTHATAHVGIDRDYEGLQEDTTIEGHGVEVDLLRSVRHRRLAGLRVACKDSKKAEYDHG